MVIEMQPHIVLDAVKPPSIDAAAGQISTSGRRERVDTTPTAGVRLLACLFADPSSIATSHHHPNLPPLSYIRPQFRGFCMSAIALGHFIMFSRVNDWQDHNFRQIGASNGTTTKRAEIEDQYNSADLNGGAAVMGFFCVSGFIMAIAYGDRDFTSIDRGAINRRNFYAKRFARLAPLYYFSLAISYGTTEHKLWNLYGLANLATFFCVQSWAAGLLLTWNGALWSVSTIAYFYYRFPWIISRVKRLVAKYDVSTVVTVAGLFNFFKYFCSGDYFFARAFPPYAMSTFLIGTVVGLRRAGAPNLRPPSAFAVGKDGALPAPASQEELRERRKWVRRADGLGVGLTLVAVAITCGTYEKGDVDVGPVGMAAYTRILFEASIPPFASYFLEAVTMAGEWCVAGKILNFAFFQLLGEWSYAIYVLQFPVCE